MKNKEEIPNLSDFEEEVFKYYARFRRTKQLKADVDRPYIPNAKTLAEWSQVNRLIATDVDELEDLPVKKKWKTLKPGVSQTTSSAKKASQPRGKSVPVKKKNETRGSGRGRPRKSTVVETKPRKAAEKRKYTRTAKEKVEVESNSIDEEGYILIPPPVKRPRRNKSKKVAKEKDDDPEFIFAEECTEEVGAPIQLRRSQRRTIRRSYFEQEQYEDGIE